MERKEKNYTNVNPTFNVLKTLFDIQKLYQVHVCEIYTGIPIFLLMSAIPKAHDMAYPVLLCVQS